MTEDKFNCEEKLKRLEARVGEEEAKKRMQKTNGCGVYRQRHRYEIDGIKYHQCLCGYRDHNISLYLDLEDKFNKGILPFNGSYMDQPSKVVEIMHRISQLKHDKMMRDIKKQQKENNR